MGTDLTKGKLTLPLLLALEQAGPEDRAALQAMVSDWAPEHFPRMHTLLDRYGALDGARQALQQYLQLAHQALDVVPESECRASLDTLSSYLARQTNALGGGTPATNSGRPMGGTI